MWKIRHPESVRTYRAEERRYKADTAVLESAKRKCRKQLKQAQQTRPGRPKSGRGGVLLR